MGGPCLDFLFCGFFAGAFFFLISSKTQSCNKVLKPVFLPFHFFFFSIKDSVALLASHI